MQIVEIGDASMIIMKDTSDSVFFSLGNIYRDAKRKNRSIWVIKKDKIAVSSDSTYTAGRLILFFDKRIDSDFKLNDKVNLHVSGRVYT